MWTIDRAKQELPDVTVELNGQRFPAQLSGQGQRFATAHLKITTLRGITFPCTIPVECAWPTIVRHLNTGTPLQA